ncbi:MAG: hypothetical protein LBD18_01445 [Treponema sp.]|jgi:hypothetical protein|nr:hypothetical protein [Treponema sp.]
MEAKIKKVRLLAGILFFSGCVLFAQNVGEEAAGAANRGSIPEELLRPRREEAPRYPVDTIIGPLGQGEASQEAYRFARQVAAALLAGNSDASSLSAMNRVFLESYMSTLNAISPRNFRLGSGREEPDGAFSFLIRFIGREQGISGELFVRLEEQRPAVQPAETPSNAAAGETRQIESAAEDQAAEAALPAQPAPSPAETTQTAETKAAVREVRPGRRVWVFDELILEEARSRETENGESKHRFDFSPYERFF